MKKNFKRFSFLLLVTLILSSCNSATKTTSETAENDIDYDNIEKPQEITFMTHTFTNDEKDKKLVEDAYYKNTGIKLTINQISSSTYYETVNIAIAADNTTDAMEVGSVYYPSYAMYNLAYDMTDIYEKSTVKNIIDEKYVDALRINGRLYGFPLSKGNGTVTYVRQDWLNQLNISQPKNYNEFYEMLKKFKTLGEDIYPVTAAGLVNTESPNKMYLPEFYQDANPDIYLKDGEYIDGMTEPVMKEALQRMRTAYEDGLFDPNITRNKTSDCRDMLYEGKSGVFNYWTGNWAYVLNKNLQKNLGTDASIIAINPIQEIKYVERPPLAIVIPKTSPNSPEAIFKYLIEYMHDNGEGELLFNSGVEGVHYTKQNGKYVPIGSPDVTSKTVKTKFSYFTPELSMARNPLNIQVSSIIDSTTKFFEANSEMSPLPAISAGSGESLPEINVIRKETIDSIVTGKMTIDEGIKDYQKRTSKIVQKAIDDLNEAKRIADNGGVK